MNAPDRGYSLGFIQSMLSDEAGRVSGWLNELKLNTVFQPAYSLPHRKPVGFEASLRASDAKGLPVSPQSLFGPTQNFSETCMLDMLCVTMHTHNFFRPSPPRNLLLLNLHPAVLLNYESTANFLSELHAYYGIPPGKLMIDVPGSILVRPELDDAIAAYRSAGCLISIDDFGVDNANLDTIWHATPTLVKIDRTVIAQAAVDRNVRQMLPKAVSLLHEMGTLVLMEGLESEMETLIAIDTDADFGSGLHLGPMHTSLSGIRTSSEALGNLWQTYRDKQASLAPDEAPARQSLETEALRSSSIRKLRNASPEEIRRYREDRRPFLNAIRHVASRVQAGTALDACCEEFLALPGSIRCYSLDEEGNQKAPATMAPNGPTRDGTDFEDLAGHWNSNWSRRDFFRRATKEPGVVQVTRQYCSLAGYPRCVTFSMLVAVDRKPVVVCGDVDWTSHAMVRHSGRHS
jgi:EAL domain-containing protein (putative c-di-GMP-specific phosphodiesterase class I)